MSPLKQGFNDDTVTKHLNQVQQSLTCRIIEMSRLKGFIDDTGTKGLNQIQQLLTRRIKKKKKKKSRD